MKEDKKTLALDIGISSLGWAVSKYDSKKGEWDIDDFGVRLWDVPQESKTLESLMKKRREKRSSRRIIQRRKNRVVDLKSLLISEKLITNEEIENHFKKINIKGNNYNSTDEELNPLYLRKKGLSKSLTNLQLYIVLLNYSRSRGYNNMFEINDNKDDRDSLKRSSDLIKKYKYPINVIFSEFMESDKRLSYKNSIKQKETKVRNKKGEVFLFIRKNYKDELEHLLDTQTKFNKKLSKSLDEKISKIIFRQRYFEDGPGDKDDESRKYKGFSSKTGTCSKYKNEKRSPKSLLVSDLFSIGNEISKLFDKNLKIDNEKKKLISRKVFEDYITKPSSYNKKNIEKIFSGNNVEFILKEGIPFEKKHLFLNKIFVSKNKLIHSFFEKISKELSLSKVNLIENNINKLGKIIFEYRTPEKIFNHCRNDKDLKFLFPLQNMNEKANIDILLFLKSISKNPMRVSKKFMIDSIFKLIDEGITFGKFASEVDEKNKNDFINKKKNDKEFYPVDDIDMRDNGVVFRSINQCRKVAKSLFKKYGDFSNVVIEVSKELYLDKNERKKISSVQTDSFDKNQFVRKILEDKGIASNSENIRKYRLWELQKINKEDDFAYDLYDLDFKKTISFKELFSSDVQVDHIIPYSKLNDNSYANKIITFSKNNQEKKNMTPIEWFNSKKIEKSIIDKWIKKVEGISKKNGWFKGKKMDYIRMPSFDREDMDDFTSRNLNDTRYITKYFKIYLEKWINQWNENRGLVNDVSILSVVGKVTSNYRKLWLSPNFLIDDKKNKKLTEYEKLNGGWGLDKVRDITPFHHAIDALILTNIPSFSAASYYSDISKLIDTYNNLVIGYNKGVEKSENIMKNVKDVFNEIINKWSNKENKLYLSGIDYFKVFNNIYEEINKRFEYSNKENKFFPIRFNSEKFKIDPIIKNFREKVNNLIPVKLTIEKDKKVNKQTEKEYYSYDPKFLNVVNIDEWLKINKDKNKSDYPFVSYKVSKRIRGDFINDVNFHKKSDAYDKNGELKENYILTPGGNYLLPTAYYGYKIIEKDNNFFDLQSVLRYKLLNSTLSELNIHNMITRNTLISYENKNGKLTFGKYNGLTSYGKTLLISDPNLSYYGKERYNKIFNNWPCLGNKNIKNLKIININLLGKLINDV